VGRRWQHDCAKAQARDSQGRDVTSQQFGFWPRWRTKRRRSQVLPAGPVRVGADPALHARGGELVEERYAAGRRCSMIVPRLKLVRHRAEMAHHSSLGSCPRRRPSAFRAHVLPLTIVPSRPRSATGSSSSWPRGIITQTLADIRQRLRPPPSPWGPPPAPTRGRRSAALGLA